jgi:uncharacterized protein (TIGR02391 family)
MNSSPKIRDIKSTEHLWLFQQTARSAQEFWRISIGGDPEIEAQFELAIARSKKIAAEIDQLAGGDIKSDLSAQGFLDSLRDLYEWAWSTVDPTSPEVDLIFYYRALEDLYIEKPKISRRDDNFWNLIHPAIVNIARPRFEAKHYADSVEAALKLINSKVKALVKKKTHKEFDGADLMNQAFSIGNPTIALDDLSTDSGRSIQAGYMQIFAGSMTGIRNPKAHSNVVIDKKRAIHLVFLASLLMAKIDEGRVVRSRVRL